MLMDAAEEWMIGPSLNPTTHATPWQSIRPDSKHTYFGRGRCPNRRPGCDGRG